MMTLLYVKTHIGHVLVLPGQRVVHPAADDDFVICAYFVEILNMCELP